MTQLHNLLLVTGPISKTDAATHVSRAKMGEVETHENHGDAEVHIADARFGLRAGALHAD